MTTTSRIAAIAIVIVLLAGAGFAYHQYSVGVIGQEDIFPEAIGLTRVQVEQRVGKPRRLDKVAPGLEYAFWQGREPYSWTYEIWYVHDIAVHVEMPNDLVGLEIDDVVERVGPALNWRVTTISYHDERIEAVVNEDSSIAIFDTGISYTVLSRESASWE